MVARREDIGVVDVRSDRHTRGSGKQLREASPQGQVCRGAAARSLGGPLAFGGKPVPLHPHSHPLEGQLAS